jgi:hypothetical protein
MSPRGVELVLLKPMHYNLKTVPAYAQKKIQAVSIITWMKSSHYTIVMGYRKVQQQSRDKINLSGNDSWQIVA